MRSKLANPGSRKDPPLERAIAVYVVALDDDVAHVDADAHGHMTVFGKYGVAIFDLLLDLYGAAHCIAGLGEERSKYELSCVPQL